MVSAFKLVVAALALAGCRASEVTGDPPLVPSAPVVTVEVTPPATSILIGESLQLTATSRDSVGNALTGRTLTWTTSAGSVAAVNGDGLVMGIGEGSTTITATSEEQSGSASVTVTAATTGETVFSDSFESGTLGDPGRWQDIVGGGASIVTAANAGIGGQDGSDVLRLGAPGAAITHFVATGSGPGFERLYLRYWLYRPSVWEANNNGLRAGGVRGSVSQWGSFGVGWGAPGGCPDDPNNIHQQEFMFAYIVNHGTAWTQRIYTQWLDQQKLQEDPPLCGGNYATAGTPPAVYHEVDFAPTANAWHLYEIETVLNTPGGSDGSTRIWVDGVLRIEHVNVRYRSTSTVKLWAVTFDTGSVPAGAYYVDDVIVRTQRP
jgi:hypothetical protein